MVAVTGDRPDARVLPNLTTPFDPPSAAGPLTLADLQNPEHRINMKQFSGKTRGSCVMLSDNSVWLAVGGKVADPWIPFQGQAYNDTAIKKSVADNTAAIAQNTDDVRKLLLDAILNKPLPPIPLIVPWGDSRSAQNWNNNTVPPAPLARSFLYVGEMLNSRFRMDSDYMQGFSGDNIAQLLDRIKNDVPGQWAKKKPSEVPPSLALLLIGTNGVNQGTDLATLLTQLNQVLDYLVGRGHKVILCAEWPRGAAGSTDGSLTEANQKLLVAYHNAILKIRRRNVVISDVWPRAADPASVNAYPRPNVLNPDNLHNSNGIATFQGEDIDYIAGTAFGLPKGRIGASSNTDQYDAALQPYGCLNVNPMLRQTVAGVSAGVLGTNATGVAPAGYTLSASAGLSVVGSFQTNVLQPDGTMRDVFTATVTGRPTGANFFVSLRQTGLASKCALNDLLEMNYEVTVSGQKNFAVPGMFIDTGVAGTRAHGGLSLTGDNIMPATAIRKYQATPRSANCLLNPLPTAVSLEMRGYFTLASTDAAPVDSSVVMDFMSCSVRKRITPTYT